MSNCMEYKVQTRVDLFNGNHTWCDSSTIVGTLAEAKQILGLAHRRLPATNFRIVARPCPDWEEITLEDVSHEEN